MADSDAPESSSLPYLKQISRIKHRILRDYLGPWATILGSAHPRLGYVDCFAGGGTYVDEEGRLLPGSPQIALRVARQHVESHRTCTLVLGFVEKDKGAAEALRHLLAQEANLPPEVICTVFEEDAQDFVEHLISTTQSGPGRQLIPTFFFVDPYGHPISAPVMRQLLYLPRVELLVNLMWFRLNMHLDNRSVRATVDQLFGHSRWQDQAFMNLSGWARERCFLDYFVGEVGARYSLRFAVPFSPEDHVRGGERRRKYYLLHFSNHPRAALLMKRVMWSAREDIEGLQFGGADSMRQLPLMGLEPNVQQLSADLLAHFRGIRITFEQIQIETLQWPFIEKHYRAALKGLAAASQISIERVESKTKRGLAGRDVVVFP